MEENNTDKGYRGLSRDTILYVTVKQKYCE